MKIPQPKQYTNPLTSWFEKTFGLGKMKNPPLSEHCYRCKEILYSNHECK